MIMGLTFRKRFKIAPSVTVNLGLKSASVRLGNKRAGRTYSTTGRVTDSVNLPGPFGWRRSHRARKGQ